MPLRSVEAATRDDAIAAAREQFGPQVRVVGVRRVRSGGVLGFFATERYVAEVAPDANRPPVPTPARGSREDDLGSSPLASAAPATAAPSSARPRAAAPARNGAAAYAAEARSAEPAEAPRPVRPATRAAMEGGGRSFGTVAASRPADPPIDDARVSELAGLLGSAVAEPQAPSYARPAPRTGGFQKPAFQKAPWTTALQDVDHDDPLDDAPLSSAPSPFTAALARMVAGDMHVRQAVEVAVEEAQDQPAAVRPRRDAERRPVRSTPVRSADTAVWPGAARQEEETVGDQVIAPSMPATQPVEVPTWAAEPEVVATPDSSREEAIAEILRSALAQGHSDEALASILRKVLDGASPQVALTAPELPAITPELVMADNVVVEPMVQPVAQTPVAPEPVAVIEPVVEPVAVAPVAPEPVAVAVAEPVAAPVVQPVFTPFVSRTPAYAPLPLPAPAIDIWGTRTSTPLWGAASIPAPRVAPADSPIWAEVAQSEPKSAPTEPVETPVEAVAVAETLGTEAVAVVDTPMFETPVVDTTMFDAPVVETPLVATPVVEDLAIEAPVLEGPVLDAEVVEPAVIETPSIEALVETPVTEDLTVETPVAEAPAVEDLVVEAPVETAIVEAAAVEEIVAEEIAVEEIVAELVVETPAFEAPLIEAPAVDEIAAEETVVEEIAEEIDAELVAETPAFEAPVVEAPVAEAPVAETLVDEAPVVDEIVDEAPIADEIADEIVAEPVAETEAEQVIEVSADDVVEETEVAATAVEEIEPLLARTASDPAPFGLSMAMSLDATSVMPPLSLLPPLPSSRGRGRPPVPPVSSRRPARPSRPTVESPEPAPEVEAAAADQLAPTFAAPVAPTVNAPVKWSLATVTRLPVAPLMAGPDIPELTEEEIALLENPDVEVLEAEVPAAASAQIEPAPISVPGDVVSRLAALGRAHAVPRQQLRSRRRGARHVRGAHARSGPAAAGRARAAHRRRRGAVRGRPGCRDAAGRSRAGRLAPPGPRPRAVGHPR